MEHKFFIADGSLCVQISTNKEDEIYPVLANPYFQIWFRERLALDERVDTIQFGTSGEESLNNILQFRPGIGIRDGGPDVDFISIITTDAIQLFKQYSPSFVEEYEQRTPPVKSVETEMEKISDPSVKFVLEYIVSQLRSIYGAGTPNTLK